MLLLALLLLGLAAFLSLDAIVAPSRQRRALLRRASTYGTIRGSVAPTGLAPHGRVLDSTARWLARSVLKLNPRTNVELVRTRLIAAGLAKRLSPLGYLALRGAGAAGGLVLGILLGAASGSAFGAVVLVFAFSALGFILPEFALSARIRARRERLEAALPDALDLLAVSVEAGLGFDAALVKLIEHMEGPLIEELGLALSEIRMGQTRHAALKAMVERLESTAIAAFVRAVVQADQFGISLGQILRIQASEARARRQGAAEEKAMKLPLKVLFPTVVFIFPSVFLILLGPALLNFGSFLG